jgi:hypothetical protein
VSLVACAEDETVAVLARVLQEISISKLKFRATRRAVAGKVESMHLGYGMGARFALANEGMRTRVQQLIACRESEPQGKI